MNNLLMSAKQPVDKVLDFDIEDLSNAYRILNLIEKPRKLNSFLNSSFGKPDSSFDIAIKEYAIRHFNQNLFNVGIREGRDRTIPLEKAISLLDSIATYYEMKLKKADKTANIEYLSPSRLNSLLSLSRALTPSMGASPIGSFDLSEMLSAMGYFLIARQSVEGVELHPSLTPVISLMREQSEEYIKNGYPYDVLVHDNVALHNYDSSLKEAKVYLKSDYISSFITFTELRDEKSFMNSHGYAFSFQL